MGTSATHDASAPFAAEIDTLRAPAWPIDSTANEASPRCQLRGVQPFGSTPAMASNEPLAMNWVTPASSSGAWPWGWGPPDLQAVPFKVRKARPQAAMTISAGERNLGRDVIVPPSGSGADSGKDFTSAPAGCQRGAGSRASDFLTARPASGNPKLRKSKQMTSRPQKLLFFDCETTGLPRTRYFSPEVAEDWPHLVQLAWARYDVGGRSEEARSHIIRPDGFRIPAEATAIHGISHARAVRDGRGLGDVLDEFLAAAALPATMLVAHNLSYDTGVIGSELVRSRRPLGFLELPGLCTMKGTTELCQLTRPGGFGYKWPTLEELHIYCFGHS